VNDYIKPEHSWVWTSKTDLYDFNEIKEKQNLVVPEAVYSEPSF
jgi:hypothetical protein